MLWAHPRNSLGIIGMTVELECVRGRRHTGTGEVGLKGGGDRKVRVAYVGSLEKLEEPIDEP